MWFEKLASLQETVASILLPCISKTDNDSKLVANLWTNLGLQGKDVVAVDHWFLLYFIILDSESEHFTMVAGKECHSPKNFLVSWFMIEMNLCIFILLFLNHLGPYNLKIMQLLSRKKAVALETLFPLFSVTRMWDRVLSLFAFEQMTIWPWLPGDIYAKNCRGNVLSNWPQLQMETELWSVLHLNCLGP